MESLLLDLNAGSALLLSVLDPLLEVEDSCREHAAIHPPRGQQLEQLARTQGGAAGGVQVTMDRGEEQSPGIPGEKAVMRGINGARFW